MASQCKGRFVAHAIAVLFIFDVTCGTDPECGIQGETANCTNKDLVTIPTLQPKIKILNLDGNTLSILKANSFVFTRLLTNLSIANSQVGTLDNDTFKGLNSLLHLNLSHNNIKSLPVALFGEDLKNLQYLCLQYNSIPKLSQNSLDHLVKLKELHLEHNKLSTIHPHAFTKLAAITWISVDHNSLVTANSAWFYPVNRTLTHISLGHNPWRCDQKMCGFKNWTQTARSKYPGMISIVCSHSNTTLKNIHTKTLCNGNVHSFFNGINKTLKDTHTDTLGKDNVQVIGIDQSTTLHCPDKRSTKWKFNKKTENKSLTTAAIEHDERTKIIPGKLTLTNTQTRDTGSYCCYDSVSDVTDHSSLGHMHTKPHCIALKVTSSGSPEAASGGGSGGTAVAIVLVILAVGAVSFWYFRRKRRNYGLLNDESVFQPSYDDPMETTGIQQRSSEQGGVGEAYV